MTSKWQVFSFTVPKETKIGPNWRAKKGILSDFFTSIVAKHQKIGGGPFAAKILFVKKLHNAEKN